MNSKIKIALATAFLSTALSGPAVVNAQVASPSPKPLANEVAAANKVVADSGQDAAKPAPSPEPDFWHRETITGDWGGDRTRLKEKGVELNFKLSNFYQGTADGGFRQVSVYNGKFSAEAKFDLGKLAGWKWWSAELKTETRFGGPLLPGVGAINPTNTTAIIPKSAGTVGAVTALNFTKLFPLDLKKGKLIAISFGRFNMLDLVDEDFFGGEGINKFFNVAQIGPLTVAREVPIITNLVSLAYIKGGEPFITFALLDPNDHSTTTGIPDLFADGVTFSPGINFPVKYFGKTAKHSLAANITTKKFTPFDEFKQIILPGPPTSIIEPKRGSWSVIYTFRQFIVERGRRDGWGFFSQISAANPDTSPITRFINVGLGGNGLFKQRRHDEFGIGYAYTDLSRSLKDNLDPLNRRRLLAEHQVEMFYNFHITPWMRLTGDLQIIRPARPIATTAIIPGMRLEFIF